jgi:hypothetical protein
MATEPTAPPAGAQRAPAASTRPHLPAASLWPVTLALGATLLGAGVVTHWLFSLAGGMVMVLALGGWVQEMRQAARHARRAASEEGTDERT